jgi:hypothetical protein
MNPTIVESIRGFRVAIAAGVIWLIAAWVGFSGQLDPDPPNNAAAELLHRSADVFGQTGGFLVLLLLAVAIGSVSQQVFRAPAMWICVVSMMAVAGIETAAIWILGLLKKRAILRRFEEWQPPAVDLARRLVAPEYAASTTASQRRNAMERYRRVDHTIRRALLDPAEEGSLIRLLDEQANLRFGLVIPLGALAAAMVVQVSLWFLLLTPIPFAVAFQAGEFRAMCNDLLTELVSGAST